MVDMGGTPVRQPLPTQQVDSVDPFLLLHHHKGIIKEGTNHRHAGVGPHPHRGFSPVTFIFQGDVHHRDSRGNSSIITSGGIQWMNTGMGIIHSERPSKALATGGGTQEIIQLWINTPRKNKMDQPEYIPAAAEQLPKIYPDNGEGSILLISGHLNGQKGPVNPKSPIVSATANFQNGVSHTFHIKKSMNALLYILDGELRIPGYGKVEDKNLVVFSRSQEHLLIEATKDSRFLFLAGEPLDEPVTTYGPFVMSNQTEIMEAMRDYQQGKMGFLVEEFD